MAGRSRQSARAIALTPLAHAYLSDRIRVRKNRSDGAWVVYRGNRWVTWRLSWRDAYDAAMALTQQPSESETK